MGKLIDMPPPFFVPAATPENQETVYGQLAAMCELKPPPMSERIYSIVFINHGETWTATVGEPLSGTKTTTVQRNRKKVERTQRLRDPAIVLAIFPGPPRTNDADEHGYS